MKASINEDVNELMNENELLRIQNAALWEILFGRLQRNRARGVYIAEKANREEESVDNDESTTIRTDELCMANA